MFKSVMHKQLCYFFIALFSLLCVSACSTKTYYVPDPESARRAEINRLRHNLAKAGVQPVQIGETMRIIIPSDRLFNTASANLNPAYAGGVLDTIAKLMLIVETPYGEVGAYTDCEPSARLNKALSEAQAQTVIDYLWEKKVDVRVLYAVGYGSRLRIAANPADWTNRRVEINFRYMPLTGGGKTWPVNIPSRSAGP